MVNSKQVMNKKNQSIEILCNDWKFKSFKFRDGPFIEMVLFYEKKVYFCLYRENFKFKLILVPYKSQNRKFGILRKKLILQFIEIHI